MSDRGLEDEIADSSELCSAIVAAMKIPPGIARMQITLLPGEPPLIEIHRYIDSISAHTIAEKFKLFRIEEM